MPATAASLSQSDSTQSNASPRSLSGWTGVIGLATFFLVALMVYPPITDATKALETPTWVKFFGRFHVIALHLPIGILALAAMMEACLALRLNRASYLSPAIGFALKFGAWGSAIAVVFGVILARKGGFDTAEFYAHQTLGIIATVGIIGTLALKLLADHTGRYVGLYRLLFATSMAVLSIGAHFGGNMVHGDDYLTKYAPESAAQMVAKVEGAILKPFEPSKPTPEPPTTPKNDPKAVVVAPATDNATVYAALIAPVLSAKCNDCHNAEKSKGDLRLDTHELILKGGGNGETVVPGQPEKSKMITSVLLPVDEDDHMPPAKKTQLSKEEIDLLSWWVKEGASKDLKVAESGFPESLKPLVQTLLSQVKSGSGGGTPPLMIAMAEVSEQVNPALAEAMKKINGSGASLAPIAANNKELRFSALNIAKDFTDANLKDLEVVADSIVALDLAKTKVTDGALATIAKMTHLKELHLENTGITDAAGAQLKTLANLEYLNLYSTKVTDKIFGDLEGLGKLKSLYLWQTGVTRPVADAFKAKHPALTLNMGWTEADNAKVVAVAVVAPETAKPATPAPVAAPAPAKAAVAPVAVPPAAAAPAATPAPAAAATKAAEEKGKGDASTALAKANDPNAKLYADVVAPILAAKCTSCHGQEKSKGKLRMHTLADLLKGGSDGATTVIAGKPDDSLMIKRMKLAKDDDDHMPPADEPQATKEELALLLWWIEQGANEDLTIAEAKKTPEIEGYLKALASLKGTAPAVTKEVKPKAKPLTEVEKKAIADAAAKMSAINASLMQVSLDSEQLRLVCVNAADKFGDKELADLAPVAAHIVWADLARTKVTDAGLASLAKMSNLERLHLENTAITDGGLAQLSGLTKLEYLNIYGTKTTDAGIAKLATNKALKKLYVWQTGVTAEGAKKLQAAVPGLVVNVGLSEADIAKLVQAAQPPPKPVEAPKKAEPAKPAEVKPPAPAPAPAPAAKPAEVKPAAAQPAAPAPAAPKPAEVKPEAPKPVPAKEEPKPEVKPAEKPEVKADKPAASVL